MEAGITTDQREKVIQALDTNPKLAMLLVAMVEAATTPNLVGKSETGLANALATLPEAPAFSLRDNFDAISVRVPINGKFLDVAVPNETFNRSRDQQTAIADEIGGWMSTRAENRAVAEYLIAQDKANKLTTEEAALLNVYRTKFVRDTEGGLDVVGVRVHVRDAYSCSFDGPRYGALVVRSSAESK